jgi:hypothetical protein
MKRAFKRLIAALFICLMFLPSVEAKSYSKNKCKKYAYNLVVNKYHWSKTEYDYLVKVWNRESGWNAKAYNKRSGACGIPQAKPCSKMKKYGKDYRRNCKVQIQWGLNYIKKRYKTPSKAWAHIKKTGWY